MIAHRRPYTTSEQLAELTAIADQALRDLARVTKERDAWEDIAKQHAGRGVWDTILDDRFRRRMET